MRIRSIIILLLLLTVMACIFFMSSKNIPESKAESTKVVKVIAHDVLKKPELMQDMKFVMSTEHFVRKSAHFITYMTLGILSALSLVSLLRRFKKGEVFFYGLIFCALYAASDEIHQIFSKRGAMISDVLLDTCGAAVGVGIIILIFYIFRSLPEKIYR